MTTPPFDKPAARASALQPAHKLKNSTMPGWECSCGFDLGGGTPTSARNAMEHHRICIALSAAERELSAMRAERDEAVKALRPFNVWNVSLAEYPDSNPYRIIVNIGDLRLAASILSTHKDQSK